jgi:hypothetical protein
MRLSLCYELISSADRNKQTARGRSTQCTNSSDPIISTSELLLRQNCVTAHIHQFRLADLSVSTVQQKTTGQNLPSELRTGVHSWLKNYATSQKVTGSSPDEIIDFLNLPNSSIRNGPWFYSVSLSEISTKNCFWAVVRGRRVSPSTSPSSVSRLSRKCGSLDVSQPYRIPRPDTGITLLSTLFSISTKPRKLSVLRLGVGDTYTIRKS